MELEFSFDEISLDQQVSREQLEIDLYDELITISDAEPDEQMRLLAARPQVGSVREADRPESIRITSSLAKVPTTSVSGTSSQIVAGQGPVSITPALPNGAPSQPLPSINPYSAEGPREATPVPPRVAVQKPEPLPPAVPTAIPPDFPGSKTGEIPTPRALVQQPVGEPSGVARPSAPVAPAITADPAVQAASGIKCQDCGQLAGELDMICIECGAFLG
jgi:hypothetical protein